MSSGNHGFERYVEKDGVSYTVHWIKPGLMELKPVQEDAQGGIQYMCHGLIVPPTKIAGMVNYNASNVAEVCQRLQGEGIQKSIRSDKDEAQHMTTTASGETRNWASKRARESKWDKMAEGARSTRPRN